MVLNPFSPQRRSGGRRAAAALAATLWSDAAAAGAWLQPEGRGQIIFNGGVMAAGQRFGRNGRTIRTDRFVKQDSGTLVEYGFRRGVTLLLLASQRIEGFTLGDSTHRVSTNALGGGARVALWRGDSAVVSAQFAAMTGLERSLPALDSRFGPRHEADARVLAGRGFDIGPFPAFIEAQAGYRWRSGRHVDEARLDLTFGVRPFPRLLLLLQSFNAFALQGEGAAPRQRPRQHKLQASAVLDLTDAWSLQAGVFASPAGRSALKERGAVMGVWRKF
jgi:protein XagA